MNLQPGHGGVTDDGTQELPKGDNDIDTGDGEGTGPPSCHAFVWGMCTAPWTWLSQP